MSEPTAAPTAPTDPITLDDLRHKALAIRVDVEDEVRAQVTEQGTRLVLIGVAAVIVVLSLAYFAGSRAGRRAAEPPVG